MAQSFEPVLKDRLTTGEPFHWTLSKLPSPSVLVSPCTVSEIIPGSEGFTQPGIVTGCVGKPTKR